MLLFMLPRRRRYIHIHLRFFYDMKVYLLIIARSMAPDTERFVVLSFLLYCSLCCNAIAGC